MRRIEFIALLGVITVFAGAAYAADNKENDQAVGEAQAASYAQTPLGEILDAVSRNSGKTFLVDARVFPNVVVGQPRAKDVTFSMLLTVLRNNGLAAVSTGGTTSIIPVAAIRQYPLPVLFEDDDSIDGEEWVTRIVGLRKASATQMVPILRPLLPKQGHMAAHKASNTLLIVDRYANVRRVLQMILAMDASAKSQDE